MAKTNHRLWGPISQAFDVYRRSSYGGKNTNYEQLWRLVQLHEAVLGVLTALSVSRLVSIFSNLNDDQKRTAVELLFGEQFFDAGNSGDLQIISLSKGTEEKVVFLQKVKNLDSDPFFAALKSYLDEIVQEPKSKSAVEQIGNLKIMQEEKIPRLSLFRGIMFVRNKVAHVPLPSDVAKILLQALEVDVAILFGCKNVRISEIDHKYFPDVLKGSIQFHNSVQTGMDHRVADSFQKNAIALWSSQDKVLSWSINPFLLVGDQLKTWVLARINEPLETVDQNDLQHLPTNIEFASSSNNIHFRAQAEYHRYAAEHRSVDVKNCFFDSSVTAFLEFSDELRAKAQSKEDSLIANPNVVDNDNIYAEHIPSLRETRDQAYYFSRIGDYAKADAAFDDVYKKSEEESSPWEYNESTRLIHGLVNLSLARDQSQEPQIRMIQLDKAIKLFQEASKHRDPQVGARAIYENSKAYYHKWKLLDLKDAKHVFDNALSLADEALHLAADQQYQSWKSFLSEKLEDYYSAPHSE